VGRITKSTRIVSAGFPRSGNAFLKQLLEQSFPNDDIIGFTHSVSTLDTDSCVVPVRNPYQSVPSWCAFSGEQDLEATARWYMRFNTKVLDNIDNLLVVNFVELSTTPLSVIDRISNQFNLSPIQVDYLNINKNAKFKNYQDYDSTLMKDCYDLYKGILNRL
jgi:hypothetical protein